MNLRRQNLPHIALFAPLYSGKSTVAEHLEREFTYTRLAFANEVKFLAADMLNIVRAKSGLDPITIDDINANKALYRPFLQWLGTDYVRQTIDPDFWIKRFTERAESIVEPIVVDDLRFPNEAKALKRMGFHFIRVDAPERRRFDNFVAATTHPVHEVADRWIEVNNHESERYYENIQNIAMRGGGEFHVIDNGGDYDDLFAATEDLVMRLTYGDA